MRTPVLVASLFATILFGCSDDSGQTPDAGGDDVDASTGPDANEACPEPTSVLPDSHRPINMVSMGAVTDLGGGVVTIDATAGGSANAPENPYIYLSFSAAEVTKADVTDTASYAEDTWDLAIKRAVFRVNSGDSGPAGVKVANVSAATLDEVTDVPADTQFLEDDWVTDDCVLNTGPLTEPLTAIGTWYDYDMVTHELTPMELVYVLKRGDGAAFKFRISTWSYMGENGVYEIEWAAF